MIVNYQLHTNELTDNWIESIKAVFPGNAIKITISDGMDENEYLDSPNPLKGTVENTGKPL